MTPTAEWYEADADDADRSVTDDVAANTPVASRGANLPASDVPGGDSDAHLLKLRTAALNRTSAENERLRGEVERLRQGLWDVWAALGFDTDGDTGPDAWIAGSGVDNFIARVVEDAAEYRREAEADFDELSIERDALARAVLAQSQADVHTPEERILRDILTSQPE